MSDELTPEERKALDSLPRERMPAGLEERVVGAMREHGFLARRRRTITLSNTRVTGLLAACVALVIGAYSIGLYRGGNPGLPPDMVLVKPAEEVDGMDVEVSTEDERIAVAPEEEAMPEAPAETKAEDAEREEAPPARQTPKEQARKAEKDLAAESSEQHTALTPSPQTDKDRLSADEPVAKSPSAGEREALESEPPAAPAAKFLMQGSAESRQTPPSAVTFNLNGTLVTVEAPDSVRVVQDDQGRMLIIYTSDGIIRIRLASDH